MCVHAFAALTSLALYSPLTTSQPSPVSFGDQTVGKNFVARFIHAQLFPQPTGESVPSPGREASCLGAVLHLIQVFNGSAMTKTDGHRAPEIAEADFEHFCARGCPGSRLANGHDRAISDFTHCL